MASRSETGGVLRRLAAFVRGWFARGTKQIAIADLNPGTGRGLGIEPLEERIAPGTLIVNPPGQGHGTEVELPDAAEHGRARAVERSPALEEPDEPPAPGPDIRVGPV